MAGNDKEQSKVSQLTTALDHAWRWYDLRISGGIQILNLYLLGIAVLISAYVSAFISRNPTVAVTVGVVAEAVTFFTYMIGVRQDAVARIALSPIEEIEDRLADALDIDSIRLVKQYRVKQELTSP